jgi:hypothetical protein
MDRRFPTRAAFAGRFAGPAAPLILLPLLLAAAVALARVVAAPIVPAGPFTLSRQRAADGNPSRAEWATTVDGNSRTS